VCFVSAAAFVVSASSQLRIHGHSIRVILIEDASSHSRACRDLAVRCDSVRDGDLRRHVRATRGRAPRGTRARVLSRRAGDRRGAARRHRGRSLRRPGRRLGVGRMAVSRRRAQRVAALDCGSRHRTDQRGVIRGTGNPSSSDHLSVPIPASNLDIALRLPLEPAKERSDVRTGIGAPCGRACDSGVGQRCGRAVG